MGAPGVGSTAVHTLFYFLGGGVRATEVFGCSGERVELWMDVEGPGWGFRLCLQRLGAFGVSGLRGFGVSRSGLRAESLGLLAESIWLEASGG